MMAISDEVGFSDMDGVAAAGEGDGASSSGGGSGGGGASGDVGGLAAGAESNPEGSLSKEADKSFDLFNDDAGADKKVGR